MKGIYKPRTRNLIWFHLALLFAFFCLVVHGDPYKQLETAKNDSEIYAAIGEFSKNQSMVLSEQILEYLLTVPESFLEKPTKLRIPDFPVVELLVSRGTESLRLFEGSIFMSGKRVDKELEIVAYLIDNILGEVDAENYVSKQVSASSGQKQKNWSSVLEYQKSLDRKNFLFTSQNTFSSSRQIDLKQLNVDPVLPTVPPIDSAKIESMNGVTASDHNGLHSLSTKRSTQLTLALVLGAIAFLVIIAALAIREKMGRS